MSGLEASEPVEDLGARAEARWTISRREMNRPFGAFSVATRSRQLKPYSNGPKLKRERSYPKASTSRS